MRTKCNFAAVAPMTAMNLARHDEFSDHRSFTPDLGAHRL